MTGVEAWQRLAGEDGRLHALYQQGRFDEVLAGVAECRATMATLADPPVPEDDPSPRTIRESILAVGVAAAHTLGDWERALELNAAVRRSQEDRGAGEVERAVTSFNDYGPLLRLTRGQEALDVLRRCQGVFEGAGETPMLANTLSALAHVEMELGGHRTAVQLETDALRLKYGGSDPEAVAVSHYNLSNYLIKVAGDLRTVWAHRLAAAVIRYQTDSPRLTASLQSIGRLLGERVTAPYRAPVSFDEVCTAMGALPFAELFATLPARAPDGQAAIDEVLRSTEGARDSAIEDALAAWEPVISALVAAQRPDTAADVTPLLDDTLAELRDQQVWRELVVVLYRMQAGPDHHDQRTIDNLDAVSAAVADRARAALAGEVTVDPEAWRMLAEA